MKMKMKIKRTIVKTVHWLQTLDTDMVLLTFSEIAISTALLAFLIAMGNTN